MKLIRQIQLKIIFWNAFQLITGFVCLSIALNTLFKGQLNLIHLVLILLTVILVLLPAILVIRREIKTDRIHLLIDKKYPQMQFSSHLLSSDPKELKSVEKLQLERILKEYKGFNKLIGFNYLTLLLLISMPILGYSLSVNSGENLKKDQGTMAEILPSLFSEEEKKTDEVEIIRLIGSEMLVFPPAYTQKKSFKVVEKTVDVPEGSRVRLNAKLSGESTRNPEVIINGNSPIEMKNLTYSLRAVADSYIQIKWQAADSSEVEYSQLYQFRVSADQAPSIEVLQPDYSISLDTNTTKVQLRARISDDYGLVSAQLVQTISRGEGESVKFRERRTDLRIKKEDLKNGEINHVIDPKVLGMEKGDELYYFLEVRDNKPDNPNVKRSETRFIRIPDRDRTSISMEAGFGLDIMPEYFRSQRQIIIDTEKLIANRSKMTAVAFKDSCNSLARDQKALRLRYGQFMGEESNSALDIEQGGGHDHEGESGEDPLAAYTHDHDSEEAHDREVLAEQGEDKEDPISGFMHNHDDAELNTFHFSATRDKLRAALNLMWKSELELRLYRPKDALPIEKEILDLLNDVKNHARIYLERIGFQPPPIKMNEKRLSGELEDIAPGAIDQDWDKKDYLVIDQLIQALSEPNVDMLDIRPKIEAALQLLFQSDFEAVAKELDLIYVLNSLLTLDIEDEEKLRKRAIRGLIDLPIERRDSDLQWNTEMPIYRVYKEKTLKP